MPAANAKHKILLTGGAGFIGSHVAQAYLQEGCEVVIVDNLSTGRKENIPNGAKFYEADIRDEKALEKILQKERPTVVNHHAAQVDVRFSVAHPQEDAKINLAGGMVLLDLSRRYGVKKWIYASTGGALYGEVPNQPAEEETPIHPLSPYAVSKYCMEKYLELYGRLHAVSYTTLRYANVYGPRQTPKTEGRVTAIFIQEMLQQKSPTFYGDGTQERDFVYVADAAKANVHALRLAYNGVFNIGTGEAISIHILFELLKKELKFQGYPQLAPKRLGEVFRSVLDIHSAKTKLKWAPETSLKEGLQKTIDWQKNAMDKSLKYAI